MIGICDQPGSYSDRWIARCEEGRIPFRRIDCLATDVVQQCSGVDAVLWHWKHVDARSQLVARQIIASLEARGLIVFPNVATCWHYDDKVGQKYLLEAIGAPLIPTWAFVSEAEALGWIEHAEWPKVFKLRCGAGSSNVRLVNSRDEAVALCRKAFGRGFPASAGYLADFRTRVRRTALAADWPERVLRAPSVLRAVLHARRHLERQRGYLYFQDFLGGNAYDTRITVIGDRAFGFLRTNRPGDFRASGSGSILYEYDRIDPRSVAIAFDVAGRLATQSLAFDFLFDGHGQPRIAEISYCYLSSAVHRCEGHWDGQGEWHPGHVWPEDAILEDVMTQCHKVIR